MAEYDNVNNPSHYTQNGGIECIQALRACLTFEEYVGLCRGNVIKYLWRYRRKNGIEDLKKAQVYLNWLITAWEEANHMPQVKVETKPLDTLTNKQLDDLQEILKLRGYDISSDDIKVTLTNYYDDALDLINQECDDYE